MAVNWAAAAWCLRHWMSLGVTCVARKQLGHHWRNCTRICYPPRTLHSFITLTEKTQIIGKLH